MAAFHNLIAVLEDAHMPSNLSAKSWMVAGSGSTLIAALLVYPADMLKTRLIIQNVNSSSSNYCGIMHGFRKIWKTEGFMALYKGLFPTFLGVIPFAGGSFLAYEILDSSIPMPPGDMTPMYMFFSGCLAAAVAKVVFLTYCCCLSLEKKMYLNFKSLSVIISKDSIVNTLHPA